MRPRDFSGVLGCPAQAAADSAGEGINGFVGRLFLHGPSSTNRGASPDSFIFCVGIHMSCDIYRMSGLKGKPRARSQVGRATQPAHEQHATSWVAHRTQEVGRATQPAHERHAPSWLGIVLRKSRRGGRSHSEAQAARLGLFHFHSMCRGHIATFHACASAPPCLSPPALPCPCRSPARRSACTRGNSRSLPHRQRAR